MVQSYTQRVLVHGETLASPPVLLGTVPPGLEWILRDVIVENPNTAAIEYILYVVSTGVTYTLVHETNVPRGTRHLELRQTVSEGDKIYITCTTAGMALSLVVTGYVFLE